MAPSFVDIFSGAGGLSLGLINAGWQPIAAIDSWKDATVTYSRNFKNHRIFNRDLSTMSKHDLIQFIDAKPDWVVGGPPCQGFSTVGKRIRTDPRNFLVEEFARVIKILNPDGILLENVLGLKDMKFVASIRDLFESMGYRITPLVLRSSDFGVPQLRRRVFFVGDKNGNLFTPPSPTHFEDGYVTVWDAIGDLPVLEPGQQARNYDKPAFTSYQKKLKENSEYLQGHVASNHPEYLVKAISFISDGGNRRQIPDEYQPRSGYHNSYSRLYSKAPAVAVTQNMGKPSGTRCIHPFQDRGLTAREGARLQGFPDRFHFSSGITSQRLQIANAVPPILAGIMGRTLAMESHWTSRVLPNFMKNCPANQLPINYNTY